MVCKHCGKEIREGLMCCPECGKKLSDPIRREKQQKKYGIPALLIGIGVILLGVAAVVVVNLQKPQKKPSELFKDYDLQFAGYEVVDVPEEEYKNYTYDYNADLYRRDRMVNVYLTITNLSDHEVMLDTIDENDMKFTLWAQEEVKDWEDKEKKELETLLDEMPYYPYAMRGNFYDANGTIVRFHFNQVSLLPGESCSAVITLADDIHGGLNYNTAYVEVSYNEKSYYWDLFDRVTEGVKLKAPDYPDREKLGDEKYETVIKEYRDAQLNFEKNKGVMF